MEFYPYNASFNGLQTVEGQNYCFIAASKGYKRYQVLSSETISRKKEKVSALLKQMLACSAMCFPDFTKYVMT